MLTGKFFIHGIRVLSLIGAYSEERLSKRELIIDAEFSEDISLAVDTDALGDTVDYDRLCASIRRIAESSSYVLIESLAYAAARACLMFDDRVLSASVTVTKPGCPNGAVSASVSVELFRGEDADRAHISLGFSRSQCNVHTLPSGTTGRA